MTRLIFLQLTILSYSVNNYFAIASNECRINVKRGMDKEHPPQVISLGDKPKFVYPLTDNPAELVFQKGQHIEIFCPGKTNKKSTKVVEDGVILANNVVKGKSIETIECVKDDTFKVKSKNVRFQNIACQVKQRGSYNAIIRDLKKQCGKGERYEIGFNLKDNTFLKTIDFCHNQKNAKTLWAHSKIVPVNQDAYRHSARSKSYYRTAGFYDGMHMSNGGPYNLAAAYDTFTSLLGGSENADKYVSRFMKDRKFLAKGHLIANADKLYKSEQDSTYYYVNVVPMWQQINAKPGNWFFVEDYARYLSFHKQCELEVWAGGIGVLELENTRIYLEPNGRIPVPQIIFKCLADHQAKEGICFLVVNNPYLTKTDVKKEKKKYEVCKRYSLCDKISENRTDTSLGYMYCCTLGNFYTKLHNVVGLEDLKGLKT